MNPRAGTVPSLAQILSLLLYAEVRHDGKRRALRDWMEEDRRQAHERRNGVPSAIFPRFAAAILERSMSGGRYERRAEAFEQHLGDPQAVDASRVQAVLREARYSYVANGTQTVLALAKRVSRPDFSWPEYFARAEANWETGFEDDDLRRIPGVGPKTRDFALSEFSDYFCAPDLHVCRMMARTGLVLHGYGDPNFSTVDYGFVRRVIQKLAKETGFPGDRDALSPAHIDRMFWYYGQDRSRCDAKPDCDDCPADDICLTCRHRDQWQASADARRPGHVKGEQCPHTTS